MRVTKTAAFGLMVLLSLSGVAATRRAAARPGASAYHPAIDPANFQAVVDNPYFPLVLGTRFKYVEKLGWYTRENVVTVTHDTKTILGVNCVVVHDHVHQKGVLREDTFDWYAQDKQGNVWYFGEDTREYGEKGKVSTEGSWEAGVDGAQPGILMKGQSVPGEPYRQGYLAGHAEDMGQIIAVNDLVTVPFGSFSGCVRTKEWSMLEPGTERTWYAKGIGVVRTESTTREVAALVSVTRP